MNDECHCDESFRTAEDYRDHLPCRPPPAPHFNALTPAEAEALAILAEECGEVVQRIGKILRNGMESRQPSTGIDNRTLLETEIGDICAILDVLADEGIISDDRVYGHQEEKLRKFREEPGRLHHITVKKAEVI